MAANNAQIKEWQAEDAITRGAHAASDPGIKTNQLEGRQRAAFGASGVDLGVGSAAEILTDTEFFGAIDSALILGNAARHAWGYRNEARRFASDASLLQLRSNAEHPWLSAGTSLLTLANRVAPQWYGSGFASRLQAGFSNTRLGGPGFGSGLAYGNADLGENF